MPNLRDSLLPVIDTLRSFESNFGTRRFAVTVRRRVWTGSQPGEGQATDYNIALIPKPRVRDVTASNLTLAEQEMAALSTNRVSGQLYRIKGITPRYTPASSGSTMTGGFFAEQLRLWPNRDTGAVENLVAMVGDDGYLRECSQVYFSQDRMFSYNMLVKEIDRPRTALVSVAISPTSVALLAATAQQQQLTCTGTHSGGAMSILTAIAQWSSSSTAVATVDIYGNVTAVAAGTCTIEAIVLGQGASIAVTVT